MESASHKIVSAERSRQSVLFRNVYLWVTMGLVLTGVTALAVVDSPMLLNAILGSRFGFLIMILAELGLVWVLSARIWEMSFTAAMAMFFAYSVLNGATLSVIFLAYSLGSIASTFFVTAGTFAVMAVYGHVTKRDLTSIGNLSTMALIGLIIATAVNIFLQSTTLGWIVTYIGILLFVGLTAYDAQKIRRALLGDGVVADIDMQRIALLGALSLYLDFINLFLYMLRLIGDRR